MNNNNTPHPVSAKKTDKTFHHRDGDAFSGKKEYFCVFSPSKQKLNHSVVACTFFRLYQDPI
jgi:hypothetical protein